MHIAGTADQICHAVAFQTEEENKDLPRQYPAFPVAFHGLPVDCVFLHYGAHPAFCPVGPGA